jgi:hypothetical protein
MLVRDTRQLELYVVGALVAYYAWLLTNSVPASTLPHTIPFTLRDVVRWLPVLLTFLGLGEA